jgi:hypothetical protein
MPRRAMSPGEGLPNFHICPRGERPRLPFTARIERAQFHRARSASKKGTCPLLPHRSEAARCASIGDHQAPSLSLFREPEDDQAARPPLVRQNQITAQN